jgi:peptide-methionine (S)-S-oxide reductase
VVSTRVGYAGGTSANPTYHRLGDHTETVEITYDPAVISYDELLDCFWHSHNPTLSTFSRQYMSIIFYHDEAQKEMAEASRDRRQADLGSLILTEIVPAGEFHPAEDYHQKYYLQQIKELTGELRAIYPDFNDFVASTAAARLNGYASGYGSPETLEEELESLGLSPEGENILMSLAERGLTPACPAFS